MKLLRFTIKVSCFKNYSISDSSDKKSLMFNFISKNLIIHAKSNKIYILCHSETKLMDLISLISVYLTNVYFN